MFIIKIKDAGVIVVKNQQPPVEHSDGIFTAIHQCLNNIKAFAGKFVSTHQSQISSIRQDQEEIQATLEQLSSVGNAKKLLMSDLVSPSPPPSIPPHIGGGKGGAPASGEGERESKNVAAGFSLRYPEALKEDKKLLLNGITLTLKAGMSTRDIVAEINQYKLQTGASAAPAPGDEPLKFTLDSINPNMPFKLESVDQPFILKSQKSVDKKTDDADGVFRLNLAGSDSAKQA